MEARKQPNVFIQTHIYWEAPKLNVLSTQELHLQNKHMKMEKTAAYYKNVKTLVIIC